MKEFLTWTCPSCSKKLKVEMDENLAFDPALAGTFTTRYLDPAFDAIQEAVLDHRCDEVS